MTTPLTLRIPVCVSALLAAALTAGAACSQSMASTEERPAAAVTRLAPEPAPVTRIVFVPVQQPRVPAAMKDDLEKGRRMVAIRMLR